ncbi:MAG: LacI family DNA-binding transcriptional regulator [Verrucomicrobia bacterium]|nr:LacI family DNA-binding transcriptional regulator [Verrucomicrobiota bacterium]
MPTRRPTILDVAARAGVSKSTVARALSKSASITDETRRIVTEAAREVGYERNHLAGGMRSGKTGLIGLVIPDIANPFWAEVARGAQDRAAETGAALLAMSSAWSAETEAQHFRTLSQVRVDGAIVNPVSDSVRGLGRFGLPFVLIGSSAEKFPNTSSVGSDIRQAVWTGLDYLVSKGHRMPCLIAGPKSRIARAKFLTAVLDHCVNRDQDPGQLEIEDGDYTVEGGYAAMRNLLVRKRIGHLSVFAANDLMALGALMAVRDAGLRSPQDVSIMGFDGIPSGAFSWPGLTTIAKPGRDIGRAAVDGLLAQINGRSAPLRQHLTCTLIVRDSVFDLSLRKATAEGKG